MARIRKTNNVKSPSQERWLVSYADYMTLMFALFVVLYASAMVKEETYEVLSESLGKIFEIKGNQQTGTSGEGILTNQVNQKEVFLGNDLQPEKGTVESPQDEVKDDSELQKVGNPLDALEYKLKKSLSDLLANDLAKLEQNDDWLTIELSSGVMFPSGSAASSPAARVILEQVAKVLSSVNNLIEVRGYTDSLQINNEIFSSNWQLSAARAAAVTNWLEKFGVRQKRLSIKANGSNEPIAPNDTAEGRAKNRRVVIALSKFVAEETVEAKPVKEEKKLIRQELSDKIEQEAKEIKVIKLPNGGIRITTREPDEHESVQNDN